MLNHIFELLMMTTLKFLDSNHGCDIYQFSHGC